MTLRLLTSLIKKIHFFLDLKVISTAGKLMTSLSSKPADSHQYGYYKSSHPELTKRSVLHILQTNFTDFKKLFYLNLNFTKRFPQNQQLFRTG